MKAWSNGRPTEAEVADIARPIDANNPPHRLHVGWNYGAGRRVGQGHWQLYFEGPNREWQDLGKAPLGTNESIQALRRFVHFDQRADIVAGVGIIVGWRFHDPEGGAADVVA